MARIDYVRGGEELPIGSVVLRPQAVRDGAADLPRSSGAWQETGDPLLAVGQFGAGRVLAYTSDPAPHWGCNFVYWDQYSRFWTNAAEWLLRGDLR